MEPSSPLNGPGIPRRGPAIAVKTVSSADNGAAAAHAFREFRSEAGATCRGVPLLTAPCGIRAEAGIVIPVLVLNRLAPSLLL